MDMKILPHLSACHKKAVRKCPGYSIRAHLLDRNPERKRRSFHEMYMPQTQTKQKQMTTMSTRTYMKWI